uniref:Uncharacterized protein TCIL3000_9_1090 n=1 Tax=Trypanosoma congolense (strain IL3000) TaxID=1068625 RepID=G0UTK0_TRYCI|nr:unnamed protein product [Trypanosoma congolense IL3000]
MQSAAAPSNDRRRTLLLSVAAATLGFACVVKLYNRCVVHIAPNCVTVVYETRRKSILASSLEREAGNELPHVSPLRPIMYLVSLLLYSSKTLILRPPTSLFSTFTLPRKVIDESNGGETMTCAVEDVYVTDGTIRMVMTVRYCIPVDQLERYLAAVGPTPPTEHIGFAVADVARARGAELSVGLIINKSKRDAVFLEGFCTHLSSKLMSELCVKLLDVTVDTAEVVDRPFGRE